MYEVVIGVDVSKEVLDVAYSYQNETLYLIQVENTDLGIAKFLHAVKAVTGSNCNSSWFVCFENTGTYSKVLLSTLLAMDIPCIEENAMHIKRYCSVARGKRDDWDAMRICQYAVVHQKQLVPNKPASHKIDKLKHLFNYRAILVDKRRALSNAVKEKHETLEPRMMEEIYQINHNILKQIDDAIKTVEKKMREIIKNDEGLKGNYDLAISVIGIGEIIGTALIIKTENFKKFTDPKKFASQIGIAPFPHQSGKSYSKPKVSKRADISMKTLISCGVNSAMIYDNQIRKYRQGLLANNKHKGIIRNNIKNKLIHRVFAVIKRGTPYVNIAA
jgi:transposase